MDFLVGSGLPWLLKSEREREKEKEKDKKKKKKRKEKREKKSGEVDFCVEVNFPRFLFFQIRVAISPLADSSSRAWLPLF
jgi:hypothetical protein